MELTYLLLGTNAGGLHLLSGIKRRRQLLLTTNPEEAIRNAYHRSRVFKGKLKDGDARCKPVVAILTNPEKYCPEIYI